MCLISEILFEYKEDVREHLPALLHILTITLDSTQSILQQHSQQVSCFIYKCLWHQILCCCEAKAKTSVYIAGTAQPCVFLHDAAFWGAAWSI